MWLPFFKNKTQLQKLLVIANPKKETIYGVIGRMEVLLDIFAKHHELKTFTPFLKTYYFVTRACAEKYILYKRYFSHPKAYRVLDVYFASLYFTPLLAYLEEHECQKPWQHYYHYCLKDDGLPILQILLGINAHINTDLYTALVHLRYNYKQDFLLVNTILKEVTPDVVRLLAQQHDIVGIGGMAFKKIITDEFKTVIERWRIEAWNNAQRTNPSQKEQDYHSIAISTEALAQQLIRNTNDIIHLKSITQSVAKLRLLSVQAL